MLVEISHPVRTPKTQQELEQAVQRYRAINPSDPELFSQWQAIRDAALCLDCPLVYGDQVLGEDSY